MTLSAFYENIRTGAVYHGIPMVEAVSALCGSGLQGIYVSLDSTRQYAEEIEEVLQKTDAAVTGLHAWIDYDGGTGASHELIDQAVRLGTDHALIVPVCTDQNFDRLIAGMRDAVDYGVSRGVRVYMEDLDQMASPYNNLPGLKRFLEAIPELYCCFDTGNLIMVQEDEVAAFRQLQGRIRALHLKDRGMTAKNPDDVGKEIRDGTYRYPVPVGSGFIRIPEILKMAGDIPMIVELYDYSPAHMLDGIRKSLEWVRETTS